jgi:hypothetical protein
MTSKQRVLETLEGRIPDRVPWGEFAVDFDTVERILGHETFLRAKARSQRAFWEGRHDEVAATPEEVRRDVRRSMACAREGGHFILGTSHSIAVGSRYDNVMAMIDEFHSLAVY